MEIPVILVDIHIGGNSTWSFGSFSNRLRDTICMEDLLLNNSVVVNLQASKLFPIGFLRIKRTRKDDTCISRSVSCA